jgi:hypothetical protein
MRLRLPACRASCGWTFAGTVVRRAHEACAPLDLLREIDQEARRLGVTRQAFIKVRLADALVKVGQ